MHAWQPPPQLATDFSLCDKIKRLVSWAAIAVSLVDSHRQQGGNVFFFLHKRMQAGCSFITAPRVRVMQRLLCARIKFDSERQLGRTECVPCAAYARQSVVKFNCFKANITMSKKKTQSAAARQLHIGLTRQRDKHTLGHTSRLCSKMRKLNSIICKLSAGSEKYNSQAVDATRSR